MGRIIFFMEEPSMLDTLRALLPKLYPKWLEEHDWVPIVFPGKQALDKGINSKLLAWREPGIRFVILRDNDNGDCRALKAKLLQKSTCRPAEEVLVRIICQELESWFLGDIPAILSAYPRCGLKAEQLPAKFREPDTLGKASEELARLTKTKAKRSRAEMISPAMNPQQNRSHSFKVFLAGLERLVAQSA
jgi:hypothetical protein